MNEIPQQIENKIFTSVLADLKPKSSTVFFKTGIAILLGGTLSMLVCGQFGLGITIFAQNLNHNVHSHAGGLACALLCGSIFSIFPVLMIRALCHPLQFRVIIRKNVYTPAAWLASIGITLAYHGEFGHDFIQVIAWLAASYLIYRLFGLAIDYIGRQLKVPSYQ